MFTLATLREHRGHRRRCHRLLQEVPLPATFSLQHFCQQVARQRQRPLQLLTCPLGSGAQDRPCGAWLALEDEDYVFVEAEASPLHRDHIVLHELGHMLCGHYPSAEALAPFLHKLFPMVGPETAAKMLGRTSYSTPEEAEAETFATMAGARLTNRTPVAAGTQVFTPDGASAGESEVLRTLSQMLGVRPRSAS